MTSTLREDRCTFMISRSVLERRNVSDKLCRQNQNTHFVFNNFLRKIVAFMRSEKNIIQPSRQGTDDKRTACWVTKATNTHPQYVIFLAFPLQRWLQERNLNAVIRILSVLLQPRWTVYCAVRTTYSNYRQFSCFKGPYHV